MEENQIMEEDQKGVQNMGEQKCTKLSYSAGSHKWLKKNIEHSISNQKHDPNDHVAHEIQSTAEAEFSSWLNEHPSALSSFKEIMDIARGKNIIVFLDYDGTLSPIVSDPDRAFMSIPMRAAVQEVSRHFPTAIISGRSRDKVYEFVKLKEVYYAGSHGMDIMGPPKQASNSPNGDKYRTKALDENGQEFIIFQPAKEFLPRIEKMLKKLEEKTSEINGVVIEDNRFCISVHYRHVLEEDYKLLEKQVERVLKEYPKFHMTRGKKVLEIRPSIKWNKGHALEYLLEAIGLSNSNDKDTIPIYIGDDKTDEDAFKVLRSREAGFPIIVTSEPRNTTALYSLRDPSEVLSFLIRMARWRSAHH